MNRFASTIAFGTLALVATALPAQAETRSVEVRYSDLSLSTPAGRNALQTRVRSAARDVCSGRLETRDMRSISSFNRCYSAALKAGNLQIAAHTAPVLASR